MGRNKKKNKSDNGKSRNINTANSQDVLKKYQIKPKKRFGQNFLVDKEIIKDTIEAAELKEKGTALEIGPGLGAITKELAKKVKRVIAIEKDKELVKILKEELKKFKNIEIVQGDILKLATGDWRLATGYKVIANLPFHISAPVIRKFLESLSPPKLMVLIVQKEVAERICARPPKMSILSISVQLYSKAEIVRIIKKESFWPEPKVDSAILKIVPRQSAYSIGVNRLLFFKIVKAGFSQPRKQLKNNLKKIFGEQTEKKLKKAKIDSCRRAETLTVEDWIGLVETAENGKMKLKEVKSIK